MKFFGVLFLVALGTALPTPDTEESSEQLTKPESSDAGSLIIPDAPILSPLGVVLIDSAEKEEPKEEGGTEPGSIIVNKPDQIVVGVVENKPPSFITTLFPNLSWPSWQLPSFNFPSLPSLSNFFGRRGLVINNPNYRYVLV